MKILFVESSKILREKFIRYLELENLFEEVFEAESVKEAKKLMQKNKIDIILFDIQLAGISGIELMPLIIKIPHKPIVILCSNYRFPQYINTYEKMSVNYFFDKSLELEELKLFIHELIRDGRNVSIQKQNYNYN